MIATIAMATRMTQSECAIEARHVSNDLGTRSRPGDPGMTNKPSAYIYPLIKTLVLLALSETSVGNFFRISSGTKSIVQICTA